MHKEVRVRFAPSPTGDIHIGNIRVAIFNYLFAHHHRGKFLLRVEDTDKQRSTQESIDNIVDSLKWLGMECDEEVFYQSCQKQVHLKLVNQLIKTGYAYRSIKGQGDEVVLFRIAYHCDDKKFLQSQGKASLSIHEEESVVIDYKGISYSLISKKGKPIAQETCLAGFKGLKAYDKDEKLIFELTNELLENIYQNKKSFKFVGISKFVFEKRIVIFKDLVKGKLKKPLDSLKDFVIVKSDGSPLFHLANVADDIKQQITHIIRGDDHVDNSYRHIFLFDAFNYPVPNYAHLPMIVNTQGKPYSKRDGNTYIGDFKTMGYLPEALFNYLSLLAWSPKDDREKISKKESIQLFDLLTVKQTATQFDANKLYHLNGLYIQDLSDEQLLTILKDFLINKNSRLLEYLEHEKFKKFLFLMHERVKTLEDVLKWDFIFFDDFTVEEHKFKEISITKELLKKSLINYGANLLTEDDWTNFLNQTSEELSIGKGKICQQLRLLISGQHGGLDLTKLLVFLGKDFILKRLK